jgi:SAM-dependent methyltransferase
MNAADSGKTYLPAAGHDWLLPLYDPFVKLVGGEAARRTLLDQATIEPGFRILDIGCGTGTLAKARSNQGYIWSRDDCDRCGIGDFGCFKGG